MNLELTVVRFENEDVIATSCSGGTWSAMSYKADNDGKAIYTQPKIYTANENNHNGVVFSGDNGFNKLDGEIIYKWNNGVLTKGVYYYYDTTFLILTDSFINANNFQTCTSPAHH